MSYAVAEATKKAVSFVIRIDIPLYITKDILEFLIQRRISLQTMQMHGAGGGEGILIIHCLVERDRLKHVQRGLEKMNGVLSVDLLEQGIQHGEVVIRPPMRSSAQARWRQRGPPGVSAASPESARVPLASAQSQKSDVYPMVG